MRPSISKLNTFILFLCTTPSILGIVILVYFTTNGLAFQNHYYLKLGMICWTTINSIVLPLSYFYSRQFDRKLLKIDGLTNDEVTSLSVSLLQMPVRLAMYLSLILLVENVGLYFIMEYQGVSQLSLNSFSISLSSSLVAVSPIGFFCSTFFLRSTNQRVYAELRRRNLPLKAPFLGYRFKLLVAFGASIIGIAIWLLGFSYYFALNNSIATSLVEYQNLQKTAIAFLPAKVVDTDVVYTLKPYLDKVELSASGVWMVVNRKGEVVLNPSKGILYTKVFPDLNERMRNDFVSGAANTFYDNKGARLVSYVPMGKRYNFVVFSDAHDLMFGYSVFWVWASVFVAIALSVLFFVTFVFSETIVTSLRYLSDLMLKISTGDLTELALVDTMDETSIVLESYNTLAQNNLQLLRQIKQKSEEFLAASKDLSKISDQTAQSSIEQAATTEELSTALQEKLGTEVANSEKAKRAKETSIMAAREMENSTELFIKTLSAIEEISQKTSIISEIANKTDMLSINASIEAARSGQIGKGFGVVAQEIRKLADRTQKASVEIDALSESGHAMSNESNVALNKLIPQVNESAVYVNDIFTSSEDQQTTTKMITTAVTELAEVTNLNAANSEGVSASAVELAENASFLFQLISNYKTKNSEVTDS